MDSTNGEVVSIKVSPIGSNPTTGYPEVMCPDCKRHFYWRPR